MYTYGCSASRRGNSYKTISFSFFLSFLFLKKNKGKDSRVLESGPRLPEHHQGFSSVVVCRLC
ncbi:unnamed protein product [Tuber melanosporum]|uniref:(Perigord truffle) hypothetical protein n=1 Tax=Tuber melanosporum (strain Mel28) TaxID=656061 RepID=D5GFG8_TUBMM|nr:uncharacterized protein GSTUM_00006888001 [Tuber melanosporum]CAZ83261.1 unnamed protein product [Tuber melanosporum]